MYSQWNYPKREMLNYVLQFILRIIICLLALGAYEQLKLLIQLSFF
nr:MAG TPA: hypothetical protein [Caudoviricetes sp.]DAZ66936.1 MAG TPA: hypothetical protein [Caudoviricetes sp.]